MAIKTCIICGVEFETGRRWAAKTCGVECAAARNKARIKAYYQRPEVREYQRERRKNPEVRERKRGYDRERRKKPEYREYDRERRKKPEYRERKRGYDRKHRKKPEYRQWVRAYQRERKKADIHFRLAALLRDRLRVALKGNAKRGSAVRDLGCSIPELKHWLEMQFTEGMSWSNIHVDHLHPLVHFDLQDPQQFRLACHYTNLRPMLATDNLQKHATPTFLPLPGSIAMDLLNLDAVPGTLLTGVRIKLEKRRISL